MFLKSCVEARQGIPRQTIQKFGFQGRGLRLNKLKIQSPHFLTKQFLTKTRRVQAIQFTVSRTPVFSPEGGEDLYIVATRIPGLKLTRRHESFGASPSVQVAR